MVYVYDNEIVTYLNFGVDKAIERVRLDETNTAIEGLKNVQTLSPLLHHTTSALNKSLFGADVLFFVISCLVRQNSAEKV